MEEDIMSKSLLVMGALLLTAVPVMSQDFLHSVTPIEGREAAAFISLDGITTFTGMYRQAFGGTADIGIRLSYGSEDDVSSLLIKGDYNLKMAFPFGGNVLFAVNPQAWYSSVSVDLGILGESSSSVFGLGCFGTVGFTPIPGWEFYVGPAAYLLFGDADDFDIDIAGGAIFQLNPKIKLQAELSEFLDDIVINLGARFAM